MSPHRFLNVLAVSVLLGFCGGRPRRGRGSWALGPKVDVDRTDIWWGLILEFAWVGDSEQEVGESQRERSKTRAGVEPGGSGNGISFRVQYPAYWNMRTGTYSSIPAAVNPFQPDDEWRVQRAVLIWSEAGHSRQARMLNYGKPNSEGNVTGNQLRRRRAQPVQGLTGSWQRQVASTGRSTAHQTTPLPTSWRTFGVGGNGQSREGRRGRTESRCLLKALVLSGRCACPRSSAELTSVAKDMQDVPQRRFAFCRVLPVLAGC